MPETFQNESMSAVWLASAARTTIQTSGDFVNTQGARGIEVIVDTTAFGTGSVTLTINGKDPASGKYYTLLAGAAIVSVVTNVYRVFPGATVTTNVSANAGLPRVFQLVMTHNNANTQSYSVGYNLLA